MLVVLGLTAAAVAGGGDAPRSPCREGRLWSAQTQVGASVPVPRELGLKMAEIAAREPDVCDVRNSSPGAGAQWAQTDYKIRASSRQEAEVIAQRVSDAIRDEALDLVGEDFSWNVSSSVQGLAAG